MSVVRALGRYGPAKRTRRTPGCELCGGAIDEDHPHVADLRARSLACACRACAILFSQPGAGQHRTVPDRVRSDAEFTLRDEDWKAIEVPVRLAFFFFNSLAQRWIALYPGPGGTTEAELPEEAWAALTRGARLVQAAQPDVEAVLAWAPRGAANAECLLVPITACYALAARLRQTWKGFDGGDESRAELAATFERLRARARPLSPHEMEGARP